MKFLYMAVDGDACKIGYSDNPHRRTRELYYESWKDGDGRDAPIVAAWPVGEAAAEAEKRVKAALVHRRRDFGHEWFTISRREMVITIRRVLRQLGRPVRAVHRYRSKNGKLTGWPCSHSMKEFGGNRLWD